eukprot:1070255-Prymnesium_polylepis.1
MSEQESGRYPEREAIQQDSEQQRSSMHRTTPVLAEPSPGCTLIAKSAVPQPFLTGPKRPPHPHTRST